MRRIDHCLEHQSLGHQTQVTSLHFGTGGVGPKAYVQASLHAEELPGMLAAYHLRALLEAAENEGQIHGEVVLVPVANPIGLAQRLGHKSMGRFELGSSENFNRNYPELATEVFDTIKPQLTSDAQHNVAAVRAAVAGYLTRWRPAIKASVAGLLVFAAKPGDVMAVGDAVVEIIDPIANTTHTVRAEVAGVLYARTDDRYALPGDDLANIAGSVPFRTGDLLGA